VYLQQVGRVLRPAPGKTEAIILDHVGNCHRHGLPDEPREWTLEGRVKRQGTTPFPIRQCEQCYTVHRPAPVCPACGFAYPVQARELEAVDGELKKVDPAWLRAVRERAAKQAEQGQARTLEELRRLAAARGYRQGWAERVYAARRVR
jgi:superfamily II DNA or RNA helicase